MKAFSDGPAMWKGLPREYVEDSAVSRSVGRVRKRWIDTVKVWVSGKQGEWDKISVNGGGL